MRWREWGPVVALVALGIAYERMDVKQLLGVAIVLLVFIAFNTAERSE